MAKQNKISIHMGEELKKRVLEAGMTIINFADKIDYSRQTIYRLFYQKAIHSDILSRSSKVLNFDFMSLYLPKKEDTDIQTVNEDREPYQVLNKIEDKSAPFLVNIQLDLSFKHHVKIFNDYTLGLNVKLR